MQENKGPGRIYRFGEFLLLADERIVMRDEERVRMTPRAFDLLLMLVENAGRLVTKESLLTEVWQDSFVEEGNINSTVSRLRKMLGEKANENSFIETVPKVGYRFVAKVEVVESEVVKSEPKAAVEAVEKPVSTGLQRVKRPRRAWLITGTVLFLAVGIAIGAWFLRQRPQTVTASQDDKKAPVRITEDRVDQTHAVWKANGQIRFEKWNNNVPLTYVMNADGTNQQRDTQIPGLKTGLWTKDEKRVVFYKDGDTSGTLFLADADGSNESRLPFFAFNMDWSPDGQKIVYQYGPQKAEIFVYDLETQHSEKIADGGDPSFSPDGKQVAFVSGVEGNAEIYVADIDGANVRRLTNDPGRDAFPAFSPDGTQIIFNREDESLDVMIMRSDGSDVRHLTDWPGNEEAYPGCWSADGTQIYFSSDRYGRDNIFRLDVEPYETHEVLASGEDLQFPSYAADGSRVLFQARLDDMTGELRIMDLKSKTVSPIVKTQVVEGYPKFSPDGKSILFQDRLGDNSEICLISSNGSGKVQNLTNNPAKDSVPSWSPDGSRISFMSNREGSRDASQVFMMNADGSNQHLIYFSSALTSYPSWSPDGSRIVFSNDKEDGRTGNFEIFAIEPETTTPETRLTFRRRYDTYPVYSPDGSQIAFVSNQDGNSEIYLMNADGSRVVRLTRNTAEDTQPSWSPDGKRIIFSSNRNGKYAIFELGLE